MQSKGLDQADDNVHYHQQSLAGSGLGTYIKQPAIDTFLISCNHFCPNFLLYFEMEHFIVCTRYAGLPVSRLYASYFGGSLNTRSMEGFGMDR